MPKISKNTDKSNPAVLNKYAYLIIIIFAMAFGITYRISLNLGRNFPLNDGGMFYAMMRNLATNNYILPKVTSYNNIDIPFAYPPLGLYLGVFLSQTFTLNLLTIEMYLPIVFSILTLAAFYFLACEVINKKYVPFAFLFFAITERSYEWQVMGGGTTRSPAMFFSLLSLLLIIKVFRSKSLPLIFLTVVFFTLTLLSHFEWFFFLVLATLIFALSGRDKLQKLRLFFLITAGAIVLSSPWWYRVITYSGVNVFLNFFHAGSSFNVFNVIYILITSFFTEEGLTTTIRVLTFIGILFSIKKKDYIMPSLLIISVIVTPRSFLDIASIPISFLSAISLMEIINILITKGKVVRYSIREKIDYIYLFTILLFVFASSYANFNHIYKYLNSPAVNNLQANDIESFRWITKNISSGSDFLLLTNLDEPTQWGYDKTGEWFPALTGSSSIITPQGSEWLSNGEFGKDLSYYKNIKICYSKNLQCIEQVSDYFNKKFSYVYIQRSKESLYPTILLYRELSDSKNYKKVFENDSVGIFRRV